MENIIVSGIILIILAAAITPIYRSRSRGIKCIGCAHSSNKSCECDDSLSSRQIKWVADYRHDHKKS